MSKSTTHEITDLVRTIYQCSDKRDALDKRIKNAKRRLFNLCRTGQYEWGKIGEVQGQQIEVKAHFRRKFKYLKRNRKWF